jgi:hypothetical protein
MANEATNGALTGALAAAAVQWGRYDDDTQRRLRNIRLDAEDALDRIQAEQSHGDTVRARLPISLDAQVGLALAAKQTTGVALVPSQTVQTRPDLASSMDVHVANIQWPPQAGQYDDRGQCREAGEMATLFLALTYPEVRSFLLGLVLKDAPTTDQRHQLYLAARSFASVVAGQSLSQTQYEDAWKRLFGTLTATNHNDPTRRPQLLSKAVEVSSVVGRGRPDLPNDPSAHNNRDAIQKWRLTVGVNAIPANTALATIGFGTPYTLAGQAYEPAVFLTASNYLAVQTATSTSFTIVNIVGLSAGQTIDFNVQVTE